MPPSPSPATTDGIIRSTPFFFGWAVTGASALAMGMTLPGQTAGVSLFIDAFIADLGVSRSAVSLAYTGATVAAAFVLPWTGKALDRWGPRRGMVAAAVLLALACLAMGQVQSLATLVVGFFLLRALGQGALSLSAIHAVNLWFVRRRGVAVGVMGIGFAVAISVLPPLIERGLAGVGWRATYGWLGVAVAAVVVPAALLFVRRRPEDFGLRPDGHVTAPDQATPPEASATLPEARRTAPFWLLTAGLASTSCLGTALLFHHVDILGSAGLSRAQAALLFVPYGAVTAVASLAGGSLVDRLGPGRVLAGSLTLFAGMMALVPFVTTPQAVWAYGAAFGIVQGVQGNVSGSGYAAYYGRAHIGAIKGYVGTAFVAATAVGPPLLALGMEALGSYALALWGLALVPLGLAAWVARVLPREDRARGHL
jgi:sugar phosphate permease